MNKTILTAGLLALLVSACAKDASAPATPEPQANAATAFASEQPASDCMQDSFYSPLPDPSVRFQFPFRIARDRIYTGDDGKLRRGLTFEYLEGDAGAIWEKVVSSMTAAGFETEAGAEGAYQATFRKKGQPGIFAKVEGNPGANSSGEDVKGSIWMSWKAPENKASEKKAAGTP